MNPDVVTRGHPRSDYKVKVNSYVYRYYTPLEDECQGTGELALRRLMVKVGCSASNRRHLLRSSSYSTARRYAMMFLGRECIVDAWRKLQEISGWRSVSEPAAIVTVGVITVAFPASEHKTIYKRKIVNSIEVFTFDLRWHALNEWHLSGQNVSIGSRTVWLIGNLSSLKNRQHGEIDYLLIYLD